MSGILCYRTRQNQQESCPDDHQTRYDHDYPDPAPPVKRLLADLTLLGEPYGVLLFALLTGPAASSEPDTGLSGYSLAPAPGHDQTITPDQRVAIQQLRPDSPLATVRAILGHLLDDAHARMSVPRVPACHGILLDTLSTTDHAGLRDRTGQPLTGAADDLVLCPKPHIGPWRVDLVSRTQHCCQDARLCHIVGRPDSRKPVRPPRSAEELVRELQHIFAGDADLDEATVQAIAAQVERLTRRFAEIAGVYRRIEVYTNRLRDMGMHRTLHLLGTAEQESLALAVFLVEQLDSIGAQDYSAPAIHLSSVLEIENQRRIFACADLEGDAANPKKQTLGTLPFLRLTHQQPDKFPWSAISSANSRNRPPSGQRGTRRSWCSQVWRARASLGAISIDTTKGCWCRRMWKRNPPPTSRPRELAHVPLSGSMTCATGRVVGCCATAPRSKKCRTLWATQLLQRR